MISFQSVCQCMLKIWASCKSVILRLEDVASHGIRWGTLANVAFDYIEVVCAMLYDTSMGMAKFSATMPLLIGMSTPCHIQITCAH